MLYVSIHTQLCQFRDSVLQKDGATLSAQGCVVSGDGELVTLVVLADMEMEIEVVSTYTH